MDPKRKTSAIDASTAERQKNVMSLSHKVDLLDWLLKGESVASVGRLYGVNKTTGHYIQKNKKAIRESVAESAVPSTKLVTHVRDVRMEKVLSV